MVELVVYPLECGWSQLSSFSYAQPHSLNQPLESVKAGGGKDDMTVVLDIAAVICFLKDA